jgi:hypothetical protein
MNGFPHRPETVHILSSLVTASLNKCVHLCIKLFTTLLLNSLLFFNIYWLAYHWLNIMILLSHNTCGHSYAWLYVPVHSGTFIKLTSSYVTLHSPRSGFARPQDSTRINHCYDSANSGCFVKRGRCAQHAKIPSGSSLTSDTHWIIAE